MKRKIPILLMALGIVLCCGASFAGFQEGVKLKADGQEIDVAVGHLVPCVTDWNNDGLKDLVVGQFSQGKIRLYLNQGTDASPKFGKVSFLEAGGKQISLPSG